VAKGGAYQTMKVGTYGLEKLSILSRYGTKENHNARVLGGTLTISGRGGERENKRRKRS